MINKTVKIKDPFLLKFFYPSFHVREELTYADRDLDIIYIGKRKGNIRDYLSLNTKRFINTVGTPDMDLTNNLTLLQWMAECKGKKISQKVEEQVKDLDDETFWYNAKIYWVIDRWIMEDSKSDKTVYNLFQSTCGNLKDEIITYFELIEILPPKVVESSFLTFLSRIHNLEDQAVNPGYMKLLKASLNKYGSKVKPAVYKLALRHDSREELAFLDLITDLR